MAVRQQGRPGRQRTGEVIGARRFGSVTTAQEVGSQRSNQPAGANYRLFRECSSIASNQMRQHGAERKAHPLFAAEFRKDRSIGAATGARPA